jgi:hypothetical protein
MKEDTAHNARIAGPEARAAYDDLCQRTLAKVPGDLNRLIYLASMRDYNSGRYHHAGLAGQFSEEAAREALETAHRELFWKLTTSPLEELVRQLEAYVQASHETPEELLRAWRTLRPYHVAIPLDVEPGAARLFVSNLKLALEVLQQRLEQSPTTHP